MFHPSSEGCHGLITQAIQPASVPTEWFYLFLLVWSQTLRAQMQRGERRKWNPHWLLSLYVPGTVSRLFAYLISFASHQNPVTGAPGTSWGSQRLSCGRDKDSGNGQLSESQPAAKLKPWFPLWGCYIQSWEGADRGSQGDSTETESVPQGFQFSV